MSNAIYKLGGMTLLIVGEYNYLLVAISIAMAICISHTGLNILSKLSYTRSREKYLWLISGSILIGAAIWTIHFLGMGAFMLPIRISYNVWFITLSLLASIVFIILAFYIIMPENINKYNVGLAGFLLGTAIVSMHHLGMLAMIVQAEVTHNMNLTLLAVIIPYVASYLTLLMYLRFREALSFTWLKPAAAFVIGSAMASIHYIGMNAMNFYTTDELLARQGSIDYFLFYGIGLTIFVIFLASRGAVFLESKLLERVAYEDTLTGVSNRHGMHRLLKTYKNEKNIGILFLDLDQFKEVNDRYGHDIGDRLIQEVAKRLQHLSGLHQQVFRIGGDEFIMVVKDGNVAFMEQLAEQILTMVKEPYHISGNEIYITVSVGIAIGEVEDKKATTLRQKADIAMYRSKTLGKNRYRIYDDELDEEIFRSTELERDMEKALKEEQFFIMYQPKWNVNEECLHGFEALLRWDHPKFGIVPPNEFIPIAEKNRMIIPITFWVLEQATEQCKAWQALGLFQAVSINLSVRLFELDDLAERVRKILTKTTLEPEYLELEITESMIIDDIDGMIDHLESLRQLGVKISMDDFGTGYSSIGLLDHIPIDTLKLDRLFINDIETKTKRAIIRAIILMAETLKLDVIAEGVESQAHVDSLTDLGCHLMQGYFYSKPMKVEQVNEWTKVKKGCLTNIS